VLDSPVRWTMRKSMLLLLLVGELIVSYELLKPSEYTDNLMFRFEIRLVLLAFDRPYTI
jgi:hypothetical protein